MNRAVFTLIVLTYIFQANGNELAETDPKNIQLTILLKTDIPFDAEFGPPSKCSTQKDRDDFYQPELNFDSYFKDVLDLMKPARKPTMGRYYGPYRKSLAQEVNAQDNLFDEIMPSLRDDDETGDASLSLLDAIMPSLRNEDGNEQSRLWDEIMPSLRQDDTENLGKLKKIVKKSSRVVDYDDVKPNLGRFGLPSRRQDDLENIGLPDFEIIH